MSRKIFISFLGITKYYPVRYYMETPGKNSASAPECFIQVSLLKMLSQEFKRDDKVIIFLTPLAEKINWNDGVNFPQGLHTQLQNLKTSGFLLAGVEGIKDIPEGFTSAEIWEIFKNVLDKLNVNDEVYLDITHAFRHIPMLALTIMNFAIAVKKIQVKAIYYGAFEKILNDFEQQTGEKIFASQMEAKIKEEYRYAPVLNLSSLEQLQQWSFAARAFQETGNSFFVSKLAADELKPLLSETKGAHIEANNLKQTADKLSAVINNLSTCRGKKIVAGNVLQQALDCVADLKSKGTFLKPFQELLDLIEQKLSTLAIQDRPAWFNAAIWCQKHKLTQQGITLLQEGIITHVIDAINKPQQLDTGNRHHRELVKDAFYIWAKKIPKQKWEPTAIQNEYVISAILGIEKIDVLIPAYGAISEKRNSINHAGFLDDDNILPVEFELALTKGINKLDTEYFFT